MREERAVYLTRTESPLGTLTLSSDGEHLTALQMETWRAKLGDHRQERRRDDLPVFQSVLRWLESYFSGRDPETSPPLATAGSPFQELVWAQLRAVPYGRLTTYGEIRKALEAQTGCRVSAQAVGGAVGANPIAILIPCHRCVGAGGNLTGYGGGIERKIRLLALEGVDLTALHRPDGTAAKVLQNASVPLECVQ